MKLDEWQHLPPPLNKSKWSITPQLTVREELAEKMLIVVVVHVSVAPEQWGRRPLRHGETLLMGRLVQKLIRVILFPWRNQQDAPNENLLRQLYIHIITCSKPQISHRNIWIYCVISGCTFEEIHLLFSTVTRSRQSKRRIHVIGDFVKAHADISGIVLIQHAVIKPPVLVSLMRVLICLNISFDTPGTGGMNTRSLPASPPWRYKSSLDSWRGWRQHQ